jgi:hypothetical protein
MARMNASRSTAARSSTSRAGWSLFDSSTNAFSIRAGLARSMTMREPPCMTRPKRNALIRPRPFSPVRAGNWKATCGMSMTTRYGLASVKARISTLWVKSTTSRVWFSSPPTRTALATGKSPGARLCGPVAPARSGAQRPPRTVAAIRTAQRAARIDIDFPEP